MILIKFKRFRLTNRFFSQILLWVLEFSILSVSARAGGKPFGNTYSHYDMFLYMFSLLHTHQTKLWHHDPQLTCLQNITGRHKIYCISFEAQDSAGVHHLERQVHLIINFSSLSWQQGNISWYPTRKQGCGFEYLTSIQNYKPQKL